MLSDAHEEERRRSRATSSDDECADGGIAEADSPNVEVSVHLVPILGERGRQRPSLGAGLHWSWFLAVGGCRG